MTKVEVWNVHGDLILVFSSDVNCMARVLSFLSLACRFQRSRPRVIETSAFPVVSLLTDVVLRFSSCIGSG